MHSNRCVFTTRLNWIKLNTGTGKSGKEEGEGEKEEKEEEGRDARALLAISEHEGRETRERKT